MLNGDALPKFLRWKIAANVVFLLNRPPSKTIGGDTSYNRISGKHADIFFLWPIGTRPHGVRQAHLALNSRHIRSRHDLHNRNSNFEPISFSDASCSTGNPEKATSTSGSMHFLSGGHPLQCSHLLRQQEAFAPSRADQLSVIYILRSYFFMYRGKTLPSWLSLFFLGVDLCQMFRYMF